MYIQTASSKNAVVSVLIVSLLFAFVAIFQFSSVRQLLAVDVSKHYVVLDSNINQSSVIESSTTAEVTTHPPKCSLQFLRQHAASHRDYPTLAFDTINRQLSNDRTLELSSSASCWFPSQLNTNQVMTAIWANRRTERILILGDSNGGRYFNATLRFLKRAAWQCAIVKKEYRNSTLTYPDVAYFVREPSIRLEHIHVQTRDCASCLSILALCRSSSTKSKAGSDDDDSVKQIWVEYIGLEYTMDNEVTTHRTHWTNSCLMMNECDQSTTTQEFIFKEYLRGQYPDVVLFFASCHDIVRFKMRHLRHNFDYLFGLMDIYLPLNTTVIFMNFHKQILSRMPKFWRDARYENGKLTSNEALIKQNTIMYQSLDKFLLSPERSWYAFPSLYDSSTATDNLYVDAVHRTDKWYDYIMNDLLYLLST